MQFVWKNVQLCLRSIRIVSGNDLFPACCRESDIQFKLVV